MSTLLQLKQLREIQIGRHVTRNTATLPASTAGNIFIVTGGRVIVNGLIGQVTTAIQNQACTVSFGALPTVGTGSATNLGTATSVLAAPIGTAIAANPGGATVVDLSTQAGVSIAAGFPAVVNAGNITITTSATNTGSVSWEIFYVPLDDGAYVTAA
jgi:hypothetical protein